MSSALARRCFGGATRGLRLHQSAVARSSCGCECEDSARSAKWHAPPDGGAGLVADAAFGRVVPAPKAEVALSWPLADFYNDPTLGRVDLSELCAQILALYTPHPIAAEPGSSLPRWRQDFQTSTPASGIATGKN